MASTPLLKTFIRMLNMLGMDPYKRNTLSNLRTILSSAIVITVWLSVLLDCLLNWNGLKSVDALSILFGLSQFILRFQTMLFQRRNFVMVINLMNEFWPSSKYTSKLANQIQAAGLLVMKTVKLMLFLMVIGMTMYISYPLLQPTRQLMFPAYIPGDWKCTPNYEIIWFMQVLCILVGIVIIIGFDGLFISLIISITCEFNILKQALKKMPIDHAITGDTKESLLVVYHIINHHSLILQCIKSIREIYSFFLLNICFYNMVCICVGLISIIANGFPPTGYILLKYGIYVAFYTAQLFYYCAAGSYLTTEGENVSDIVYNTDWWIKTQSELRKALVLVIQRANKPENLTAGGMFILNLVSFTQVIKFALSFFTLVKAVYGDP